MILGKKTLFSLLLGVDLLANVLDLTRVNFLYTTTLLSFYTCLLLPGFLLSLILRLRKVSVWENILFIVGLSIAFLEFGGLLLNTLLPLFGINNPLAFQNLIVGFDAYTLLLFIFAWIRTTQLVIHIQLPRRSNMEKIFYAVPLCFPVLATLGAIVLNNGGSNILTLILLGTIGFYTLLLVIFRDKISVDLYPYAIFFIGLACLFTISLRSWFITGADIEEEYYVFQITNTHHIWNMAFLQDAYNACLSITILPTILTNLLSIQGMYVYKVIFQVLFAISPVLVFFIAKKYIAPVLAFLSAFFFISFPSFLVDLPMANRQEISFIFFGLVVYMLLLCELPLLTRNILFLIFAFSIAVSHYSTYYIFLLLIIFLYISNHLINILLIKNANTHIFIKKRIVFKNMFNNNKLLTLPMILLIFGVTYFWYGYYTKTSNNVGIVLSEVISDISSNNAANSRILPNIFFFFPTIDPNQQLQKYIQSLQNSETADASQLYSKAITSKYNTYIIPQEQLAPTPLGSLLTTLHLSVFDFQAGLKSLSDACIQIFVCIGWLTFFSFKRLKGKIINKVVQPKFSLKMSEELNYYSSIAIDKQVTLQLHRIAPRKRVMKKTSDKVIQPRLSLKMSGTAIDQASVAIDRQETIQLRKIAVHGPSSMVTNVFDDAPNFGNPTIFSKQNKSIDLQFLLLCLGAIFLLALMVVLPALTVQYGVARMYQQFLFLLSLPIVLGAYSIFFFHERAKKNIFYRYNNSWFLFNLNRIYSLSHRRLLSSNKPR